MNLSEIAQILAAFGPLLGAVTAVVGIFALLIGGLIRMYRHQIRDLHREAGRLERETARLQQANVAAQTALARVNNDAASNADLARTNYEAWEAANANWQSAAERARQAEERVNELESDLFAATQRSDSVQTLLTSASTRIQELEGQLATTQERINEAARQDGQVWCRPIRAQPPEFIPLERRQTRIISLLNLKGGVGKTTLTANLGGYLATHHQQWALLLDLDHQRSLTQVLLSTERRHRAAWDQRTIQHFFRSDHSGSALRRVAEQVHGDGLDRLWLIGNADTGPECPTVQDGPRIQNLDDLEMDLLREWLLDPTERDNRYLLRRALHSDAVCARPEGFDYVVIDCPPRLTTACINALAASDFVLIPAQAEEISARSVEFPTNSGQRLAVGRVVRPLVLGRGDIPQ